MRYPLWAFFFVFVLPPFTAHALLTGRASVASRPAVTAVASGPAQAPRAYWAHRERLVVAAGTTGVRARPKP